MSSFWVILGGDDWGYCCLNPSSPAAQGRLEHSQICFLPLSALTLLASLFPVFSVLPFFCFCLSLVVISRVKLNFPFSYPGQHHLNKQSEQRGLRHVYRGSWQASKAKHEGGPATLSRQTSYCFWARRQVLHPLTCAWFSNNGVLSNWCFLYINGNRSTRHEDKATRQELSISERSEPILPMAWQEYLEHILMISHDIRHIFLGGTASHKRHLACIFCSKIVTLTPQAIYIFKKMGEHDYEVPSDNLFVT